jgi:hypothetical protein
MMRLITSLVLAAVTMCPALADDYVDLFEEAAAAISWNFEDEWAFTETRLVDEAPWVARFDPRHPEDSRWTLLSVDGRAPNEDELREFAHDKEDHDSSDGSRRVNIVGAETLQLTEETEDYWLFDFVPQEDEIEFVDNVDAVVRIVKDGRYLESIDIRNNTTLKPGFGVRLSTFSVQMRFGPAVDNGPIVPHAMQVKVAGRAFLFIGFDETELISYSDFEFADHNTNGTDQ